MGRTAWFVGALSLSLAQLSCQSPAAPSASTEPSRIARSGRTAKPIASSPAASPSARTTRGDRPSPHLTPRTGPRRDGHALRLATWNMQWLATANERGPVPRASMHYAQLAQVAARLNADVIAVQEVESSQALARVFAPEQYAAFISDSAGAQDVGFAVRRGLHVEQLSDVVGLNVGGLRSGADLLVTTPSLQLRVLSVHLKSGCFHGPLGRGKACTKLAAQVPPLEEWIDAREREGAAYAVLGDFNREFYSTAQDEVWSQLNDADPPGLELWSPTAGRRSQCWNSRHPNFVDHLVLGRRLRKLGAAHSFQELLYEPSAKPQDLSDHCPLSIDLNLAAETLQPQASSAPPQTTPTPVPPAPTLPATRPIPKAQGLIKGNIGSHGKKLYHLPECPSYATTKIDPAHGERWFQTEPQARAAGWTKSPNCP